MTSARYSQVTDELLSAYLDDAVTPEERRLVEAAVADEPDIAWRLESLRATVLLLHELPALALPRSFVLTPEQIQSSQLAPAAAIASTPAMPPTSQPVRKPVADPGFWSRFGESWRRFWTPGNPVLRNAMAASFAALLFFMIAPGVLTPTPQSAPATYMTTNVSNAEVADTIAAVAPPEQARIESNAEAGEAVELQRAAPEPTPIPTVEALAAAVPAVTSVDVEQGTPTIVMLGSAVSAREATGGADAGGVSSSNAVAQAAPPGPRDDVLAQAAAPAPETDTGASVMAATVSDSAGSPMAINTGAAAAVLESPSEDVALYAPAAAAVLSAPAASAKMVQETQPASAGEASAVLESSDLASPAASSDAALTADQVDADEVDPAEGQGAQAGEIEATAEPVATIAAPVTAATSLPIVSGVAEEKPATVAPAPAPPQSSNSIWLWLQAAAALGVLGFGILWWRTRPS